MKIALLGVVSAIAIMGAVYISVYNSAVQSEKQIVAQYDNLKNVLGQYSLKVAEAAQVPSMYRDDLTQVYSEVMQGRYGQDGSKAMWQWLKEQNPQIDSSLYGKIQTIVESGRDKFENQQTQFIDIKRGYETRLDYFLTGSILRFAGFPRINLADYKIIESQHGKDTFETGVDSGLKLR